jgi:hypothetical protein
MFSMKKMFLLSIIVILIFPLGSYPIGRITIPVETMGKIVATFNSGTLENEVKILSDKKGNVPFGLFNGPMSFRVENGIIYLLDSLNRKIIIKKSDGIDIVKYDSKILSSDFVKTKDGFALTSVKDLKIVKIDKLGKTIYKFGKKGSKPNEFRQVDYIGIDTMENFLVRDYGNRGRVSKYLNNGNFVGVKEASTSLFSDNSNNKYILRFHKDSSYFVVFRADDMGNLKEPIFKYKKSGRTSLELLGCDLEENIYIKVFDDLKMRIYIVNKKGKLSKIVKAHNKPGMDFNRYFVVDKYSGKLYSIFYKDEKLNISILN